MIAYAVTGSRRASAVLPQNILSVPCTLKNSWTNLRIGMKIVYIQSNNDLCTPQSHEGGITILY